MYIHACYLTHRGCYIVSFAAFDTNNRRMFSVDVDLSEEDMSNLTTVIAHAINRVQEYVYTPECESE